MKKRLTRIFILLLVISIWVSFTLKVSATEKIEDMEETMDIIMKYDAKTNTTSEVNKEELEAALTHSLQTTNSIEAYIPRSTKGNMRASSGTRVDTSSFPYRAICKITAHNNKGDLIEGSGVLVGRNLLLTAAHCVYDTDNNNAIFGDWKAAPGFNNSLYRGQVSGWATVYYSSAWMSGHSYQYDWALCVMEKEDIGDYTGYLGAQVYGTNSEMVNLDVSTSRLSC